jgi:hypothetical protein
VHSMYLYGGGGREESHVNDGRPGCDKIAHVSADERGGADGGGEGKT